jgi:hypothetical protein
LSISIMKHSTSKIICIPSQERPSYPSSPWGRPSAPHNEHQWIVRS